MSNFIKNFITQRVDAVILSYIPADDMLKTLNEHISNLELDSKVEDAIVEAIDNLNIERDVERAIEEAVSNQDMEDHVEAAIKELNLDDVAEEKLEDAVQEVVSTIGGQIELMLVEGGLEKLLNHIKGNLHLGAPCFLEHIHQEVLTLLCEKRTTWLSTNRFATSGQEHVRKRLPNGLQTFRVVSLLYMLPR